MSVHKRPFSKQNEAISWIRGNEFYRASDCPLKHQSIRVLSFLFLKIHSKKIKNKLTQSSTDWQLPQDYYV